MAKSLFDKSRLRNSLGVNMAFSALSKYRGKIKYGITGGTGFENIKLPNAEVVEKYEAPTTRYLEGSDAILEYILMKINGDLVLFVSRFGKDHQISPSDIPCEDYISVFTLLDIPFVLGTFCVGSLSNYLIPGWCYLVTDVIDRTTSRQRTMVKGAPYHIPMKGVSDPDFVNLVQQSLEGSSISMRPVVYLCIEGPRFNTPSESKYWHEYFGSTDAVVGMSLMPEAYLFKEMGIGYGAVCYVTDYDSYDTHRPSVSIEEINENLNECLRSLSKVLPEVIFPSIPVRRDK